MWPAAAKSLQLCPTLCDPMDCSLPGFSVHGILQARTLESVAISFSNAWKWKVKVKSLSRVRLLETPWTVAHQAPPSMGFSRQQYWSGVPLPVPLCGLCSAYFWIYHLSHSLVTPFQSFYHSLDKTSLLVLFFPWVFAYMVPFFSFVKLTYHPWTNLHGVHFASALSFYNLLHFPRQNFDSKYSSQPDDFWLYLTNQTVSAIEKMLFFPSILITAVSSVHKKSNNICVNWLMLDWALVNVKADNYHINFRQRCWYPSAPILKFKNALVVLLF